jgi:hypothetical protein
MRSLAISLPRSGGAHSDRSRRRDPVPQSESTQRADYRRLPLSRRSGRRSLHDALERDPARGIRRSVERLGRGSTRRRRASLAPRPAAGAHPSRRRHKSRCPAFQRWQTSRRRRVSAPIARLHQRPDARLRAGAAQPLRDSTRTARRASTWLLQNIATSPDSRLLCLDCNDQPLLWPNIKQAGGEKRTEFRRGRSRETLHTLPSVAYEFISIDGAHSTIHVLQDAVLSFRLARTGAIIAFDDYHWNDPQHTQLGVPKPAIDALLAVYAKKIEVLESAYQIWLRKLTD